MGITKDYLRFEHAGACGSVGSANGCLVAVDNSNVAVASNEYVSFYNMKTSEKTDELINSKKAVTCIKNCATKPLMAVGHADGTVLLYDRSDRDEEPVTFSGHRTGVNCIEFSDDGLVFASGGKDGVIVLWDIVDTKGLFRLHGHKESVTQVKFVRGDSFLISSSKDSLVKFWSIASQTCFYTIMDHRSEIYSMSLLRDESLLVTATTELELMVFELTWKSGEKFEAEEKPDPESKKAALMGSGDTEDVDMANMANRYVSSKLRGRLLRQSKGRALQLALSADEKILVCLGSDNTADVYRAFTEAESAKRLTKKLKSAKRKAAESITEEEVAKDVTILVTRIGDFSLPNKLKWVDFAPAVKRKNELTEYRIFSLLKNNTVHWGKLAVNDSSNAVSYDSLSNLDALGHRNDVRALAVSSTNNFLASAGGNEIFLWSTHSLRPSLTITDSELNDIVSVNFAPGDNYVIVGTKDGTIGVYEVATAELVETRKAHTGAVWTIANTADSEGFITASADKTVKFWSFALVTEGTRSRMSVRERRVLELPDEALSAALSPNGKFLVVALLNNTCSVYFMDTLKFFVSLYGHSLPVTCVAVSPDSKLVVSGSVDKSVKIWGLDFGDCHKSFHAHDDTVTSVMFCPGEDVVFWSAGKDGKIKQWDPIKFQHIQTLERHSADVRALAQFESGAVMFSASHDKSIRCWERTDEMLILEDEEQLLREEEYEKKLTEEDDVVAGEEKNAEAGVASTKTSASIAAAENIIDAIDIVRTERALLQSGESHELHPLLKAFNSKTLDHFVVDVVAKTRPSDLNRALLLVPLNYVSDILSSMSACAKAHYKLEFVTNVSIYLIRVHLSHIISSVDAVPVVEKLKKEVPVGIDDIRDVTAMNLAALRLFAAEMEEKDSVKIFAQLADVDVKKKNQKPRVRKAIIKSVV